MEGCIFCDIVNGKASSYKIWEDDKYLAFLDIFPNIKGQTIVIPKKHLDSYIFSLEDREIASFMSAIKKVVLILQRGLNVHRVNVVFEGLMINHLHAKLYPALGIDKPFEHVVSNSTVWFNKYEGYVTTQLGPRAKPEYLEAVQKEILAAARQK